MEDSDSTKPVSLLGRLGLAWRLLFSAGFAGQVAAALEARRRAKALANAAPPQPPPAERVHASSLVLLNALQREGRLIDFLQQDVSGFSDEEVGTAARVVHGGCRKVLQQYFEFSPASQALEGSTLTVPQGFDAQRIRLTGNVAGQPPFRGTLKHHGWIAQEIRLPEVSPSVDPRVIAPAEVELP
jgi:Domain of unknown function (DUF2760)